MAVQPVIPSDVDELEEIWEWIESFDAVVERGGRGLASKILQEIRSRALASGVEVPFTANTPYVNTIHVSQQALLPGDQELERKVKSLVRWNALAMVVRANRVEHNIGGHISTFGSVATLFEIGFNHFFRARTEAFEGDTVYLQGHAAPGVYARAFLEGRLTAQQLENFRRELKPGGGLSSYPHPWLMPEFWEFPTVSMGLSPIMAIYQARFNRYLEDRGMKPKTDAKVWAFLGDGETDEPEALGAITLASREHLDNLVFVINCNLQRLDGPVRGNGHIIQELEAAFRGAGWNVIKVIWGSDWDPLFEQDTDGLLAKRLGEIVDGEYQKFIVESGAYIRNHVFGADPRLLKMVETYTDEQLHKLRHGGHDPKKVYAAYRAAFEHKGSPTVILARTIKGYGLGEAGEGRNVTHQQKKVDEDTLRHFGERFGLKIDEDQIEHVSFFRPPDESPEMKYMRECREKLGGYVPQRRARSKPLPPHEESLFTEFLTGSEGREVSTTMAFVGMLRKMLRDPEIGKLIVPIVPDEARTFGMESLFRLVGIYSSQGQLYEPVDMNTLLYYKEARDGQILEEGITEAGSLSSFIAAGSAYATHGINTIPFFIFYSMFGLQRVADLIWAAADTRCRGFMLGGTAGRTTLAGEGLQHQDGNSHVLALPIPTLQAYDPAFAYEIATIIEDGIDRMYRKGESIFYYITVMNEPYAMPAMPAGAREGILKGMYKLKPADNGKSKQRAQLFGSGAILREVLKAQEILEEKYGVAADVWSVTSYKALYADGVEAERWNMLHPGEKPRIPYVSQSLADAPGVLVAASDYLKALPNLVSKWMPRRLAALGTDGFGRSESRDSLRNFFEVDARFVVLATLRELLSEGKVQASVVQKAIRELQIDPGKADPLTT
ncbi:MAG TPA: pyruvate dehydrogenase (acetyl-transferring), homodimeric type [Verrucomicrobiae bacterium]|nr:pyruvate dehydrogenase (acetyl-transferring), homodimeric type [Verrucomicrobiae bacterium]